MVEVCLNGAKAEVYIGIETFFLPNFNATKRVFFGDSMPPKKGLGIVLG